MAVLSKPVRMYQHQFAFFLAHFRFHTHAFTSRFPFIPRKLLAVSFTSSPGTFSAQTRLASVLHVSVSSLPLFCPCIYGRMGRIPYLDCLLYFPVVSLIRCASVWASIKRQCLFNITKELSGLCEMIPRVSAWHVFSERQLVLQSFCLSFTSSPCEFLGTRDSVLFTWLACSRSRMNFFWKVKRLFSGIPES